METCFWALGFGLEAGGEDDDGDAKPLEGVDGFAEP